MPSHLIIFVALVGKDDTEGARFEVTPTTPFQVLNLTSSALLAHQRPLDSSITDAAKTAANVLR